MRNAHDTTLEIIPLGGLGEFGMNCMVLRYGTDIIVIDAGLMFSEVGHFGVDSMTPDFTFLERHREQVRAVLLTHSHEDHIGSLPFLLKKVNVPVYGTPYTLNIVEPRLEEHHLLTTAQLHPVRAGETVEVGAFSVEYIRVSHSTVDCCALAITTPIGTVVHSGDFKFDATPVCGDAIDVERLRAVGRRGVLALLSDSTNIERPGQMPSERVVIPALEEIFDRATGRIFVSCFASSIHRIQIMFDLAQEFGRQVVAVGRAMERNIEIAERTGFLDTADILVSAKDFKHYEPGETVVLASGCQGEPMGAMWRIADRSHRQAWMEAGDTVVLSARQIPGNEKSISRLINRCYRNEVQVIDATQARIHVSGHGAQEDLRLMLEAVRPKYFIPIHGEYRQLYRHKLFACQTLGYSPDRVLLIESGDVVVLDGETARLGDKITINRVYIDDTCSLELDETLLRDRKRMAYEGVVIAGVAVEESTGMLLGPPEITTRGYLGVDGDEEEIAELRDVVLAAVEALPPAERINGGKEHFQEHLRLALKRHIMRVTGQKPTIVPLVVVV
ncbi:ribonuclease J [Chloracidobacterium aggregatum]|uniref:ribonuclease J n=1 Tax=Chloracidobacterium aggregatum TaxID=2851959 RepID=UPI001B8B4499|nr:ribonuclease J [Chloracidobacterium aggregatum]QUV85404.1 ribonuclease J [Chloracidobacterium sp. 2]QUV88195.1 ribonuclease J [Chloracidobacterium sp. S]